MTSGQFSPHYPVLSTFPFIQNDQKKCTIKPVLSYFYFSMEAIQCSPIFHFISHKHPYFCFRTDCGHLCHLWHARRPPPAGPACQSACMECRLAAPATPADGNKACDREGAREAGMDGERPPLSASIQRRVDHLRGADGP